MLSDRFRAKSALPSAFRRQNDAEYNALVLTHLSRSTDVSATIGRDYVVDLVIGNRRPCTVHFNFVVVANHATLGRPTIHQIAARALAVISFELRVEALMPLIVAHSVVSFLRRCAYTMKHGDRASEQRDELAAIARQILPAAAFPHFPTRKLFVDMLRRLDVPLQWFVGHFPVLCDFVTLSMTATRSNAPER